MRHLCQSCGNGSGRTSATCIISLSQKQNVARRTLRSNCRRLQPNGRASIRLDGSLRLGRSRARLWRAWPNFWDPQRPLRRARSQSRSRRSDHRHARSRPSDVRVPLGPSPKLFARRRRGRAGVANSLRMAHMITALILVPLAGALFVSAARSNRARGIALGFNGLTAILALFLWRNFDSTAAGLQLIERHAWIPAIGAEYLVGLDGLSRRLVL